MTTPLIEAIARRLASVVDYPDRAEEAAQAALTAITEAGFAVVPRWPNERMLNAGADFSIAAHPLNAIRNASEIYEAMISAAQGDGA